MAKIYCTIIGDIVNSKKIKPDIREIIQQNLMKAMDKINFDYDKYICSRFMITLGDEFQGALYSVYPLFEILEKIKASIRPYKIRFGIGIDEYRTNIRYNDSLASDGDTYYCSRQAIKLLRKRRTYEYGYLIKSSFFDERLVNLSLNLCDCISERWSDTQIKYIQPLQLNRNIEINEIAKRNNVSISTVSKMITKAKYKNIRETLDELQMFLYNNVSVGDMQNEALKRYNTACYLIEQSNPSEAYKQLLVKSYDDFEYEYLYLSSLIEFLNDDFNNTIILVNNAIKQLNRDNSYNSKNKYRCKQVKLFNLLGVSYTEIGNYDLARKSLETALNILEYEEWAQSWRIYTLGNLARLYIKTKDFIKAEKTFIDAYHLTQKHLLNDKALEVKFLSCLGKTYFESGILEEDIQTSKSKYEKSIQMYYNAISICETYCDRLSLQLAKLKLDICYPMMRINSTDIYTMLQILEEAAEIFEKKKMQRRVKKQLIDCYELMMKICLNNNESVKAVEYKSKMIKIKEE